MYKKLDKNVIKYWRITRILTFFIVAILLVGGIFIFQNDIEKYFNIVCISTSVILLYLALSIFIYPKIEYAQWGYLITNDKIQIKHGIFFLNTTIIPIVRIQNLSIENGPLKRKFKINTISITTASGIFRIEGLTLEEAESIIDNLKDKLITKVKKELNM